MTSSISNREARALALTCQGLGANQRFGAGLSGTLCTITNLSYVQIDTISVIERAHHHVLHSRVPDYKSHFIEQLQCRDRQIFEYWSHAASYLLMSDYRFSLPTKQMFVSGERHWLERNKRLMAHVLERVQQEGPLMARDFETPAKRRKGGWWDWKPAKIALEHLFIEGTLMVSGRNNFHRIYDLPERVLPPDIDTTAPSTEEWGRYLIRSAIRAHGIVSRQEIAYQRRGTGMLRDLLPQMEEAGEIQRVEVEGLRGRTYYTTEELLGQVSSPSGPRKLHLLSPFDNAVIQRQRLSDLFRFSYQLECYVPRSRRKYGYFCLPILWGDRFVGRLDPKANRKEKSFLVRNLTLEDDFDPDELFWERLAAQLLVLAGFNNCIAVRIEASCGESALGRYLS